MPKKMTIITIKWLMDDFVVIDGVLQQFIKEHLDEIEYDLPKAEALKRFFDSGDYLIGTMVSAKEVEVDTIWYKIKSLFNKIIKW